MNKIVLFGIIILLLDLPCIKYIIGPIYKTMGLALNIKPFYALCAYIVMILGWFLIEGNVGRAALLGLCIYGTYAFTLAAIMENYEITLGVLETSWGVILYTLATFLTNQISNRLI
jgi:hypothetical protein